MAERTQMATVGEVGDLLRVGRKRVYKLITQQKLRAIRFDGRGPYRIFASSVESLLGVKVKRPPNGPSRDEIVRRQHAAMERLGYRQRQAPADRGHGHTS